MKKYIARGLVYGNCWGGGRVTYNSETIKADTLKKLLKKAKTMLEDGSLDSGMGYQDLIGAALDVEEVETIKKDGKNYSRTEYSVELIGKLSKKERDLLIRSL